MTNSPRPPSSPTSSHPRPPTSSSPPPSAIPPHTFHPQLWPATVATSSVANVPNPTPAPPPSPSAMAAASPRPDAPARRNSIANLLLPQAELAEKNLISLSHLAATMAPASPSQSNANPTTRRRRPSTYRASTTHHHSQPPATPTTQPISEAPRVSAQFPHHLQQPQPHSAPHHQSYLHQLSHPHQYSQQPYSRHPHSQQPRPQQPHPRQSHPQQPQSHSQPQSQPQPPAQSQLPQPLTVSALPDDQRRTGRLPRPSSLAGPSLGVTRTPSKRMSRSKSGVPSTTKAALRAAAATSSSSPLRRTPSPHPPTPASNILRPSSSNPLAHTTASASEHRSIDRDRSRDRPVASIAPAFSPSKAAFAAAARGLTADVASNALAKMRRSTSASVVPSASAPASATASIADPFPEAMDVDIEADLDAATADAAALSMTPIPTEDLEQMEPSSSSHDARLLNRPSRAKTTPDAKRAQNRESAKRFRVAQKKRWAELQDTVAERETEIERLKGLLQGITNNTLTNMKRDVDTAGPSSAPAPIVEIHSAAPPVTKVDALTVAELELFVKLLRPQEGESSEPATATDTEGSPPLAADIGSLHRVIVSRLDGSVLGVRHESRRNGAALGGDVGGVLWEHVHSSDSAHLRASVVHAKTMLQVMGGQPSVFSYRRRRRVEHAEDHPSAKSGKESYIRMKGCLYPLIDEDGEVTRVILAEFIEI